MSRYYSFLLVSVLLVSGRAAQADPRVPPIADRDLPVAGTCAPIETADVTFVTIGPRTDLRWFGVSGVAEPLFLGQLAPVLKQRAGPGRLSRHTVWITASGAHVWAHAAGVRNACALAGIYRVGLRVRSETTGEVMGFPLFLPALPGSVPSATKAGRLKVRVHMVPEREAKAPSDLGHIYAAARRALERRTTFGVEKVVAELRLPTNTPLQYAVTAIDLLYRGGCAGVRLSGGVRIPSIQFKVVPKIEIQGGIVSRIPQSLRPSPIRPRGAPWPVDGANEPGWVDLALRDLPAIGSGADGGTVRPPPDALPNYAATREGVPMDVRRRVDGEARDWARALGADMLKGLRGGPELEQRLAPGLRTEGGLRTFILPARQQFPDATGVVPATLQFHALLFHQGRFRGHVDATISLAGRQLGVIFGSWKDPDRSLTATLPPFLVDPFAAGDPARFRVWFEAILDAGRRVGTSGLPLASHAEVLRYFPAVAQAGVRRALDGRGSALDALVARLAQTPYDRVVLRPKRGTATVLAGRTVVGVLNFRLTAQERELRIDDLSPRRAP